jgi:glycosyltransferase involved in cell wall biosynthesis
MRYSVVVPAFNEEQNIPLVAEKVSSVMNRMASDWELIFIDDGSRDGTFAAMQAARAKEPRVKIVRFRRNFGQSAGWQAGFDHAIGDIVIGMDADLQNDPEDIPAMVEKLRREEYDAISGWRASRQDGVILMALSRIGNWFRRRMTGEKIHDHGCSLKVYRRECLEDLELYSDLHRRYITALLTWKGYRVGEMKVRHHPRRFGTTNYSIRKKWKGLLDLLVVKFWIQYSTRPIHLFGTIGVVLAGMGLLLGGILATLWYFQMISLQDRTSPLLAVLLIIIGLQLVMTGILADVVAKNYYASKKAYTLKAVHGVGEGQDMRSAERERSIEQATVRDPRPVGRVSHPAE